MSVVRLILLGACIATGWLALSLAVSTTPAHAAAPAAGWGGLSDHDSDHDGLRGILQSVTSTLSPAIDVTTDILNTTVTDTTELRDIAGDTTLSDAVTGAVETVLPTLSALAAVADEAPDLLDEPALSDESAVTHTANDKDLGHDSTATTAAAVQQLTDALWPLAHPPSPWNPRDLRLTSSSALANAGSSGSAAPCDLPLVERWLTLNIATTESAVRTAAPETPTYDTDCTPD